MIRTHFLEKREKDYMKLYYRVLFCDLCLGQEHTYSAYSSFSWAFLLHALVWYHEPAGLKKHEVVKLFLQFLV